MISVIIPVYNLKPYFNEAIESVISQSFTDLEIILVDDGSTDGCGELCDHYAALDPRIKVIHQKNRGLSGARNAGLDICKGDFIAFLDADDAYHPDALSRAMEAMQKYNTDIVEFNVSTFYTSGKLDICTKNIKGLHGANEGVYTKREAMALQIAGKLSTAVWNKIYKRVIWDNFRFSVGQFFEDLDIILPLLYKSESLFFISDPLLAYRIRLDSITNSNDIRILQDHISSFVNYASFIEAHIPECFTTEDLEYAYRIRFSYLLFRYSFCSCTRLSHKKQIMQLHKQEIYNYRKRINIRKCSLKVRIAYYLLLCMPWAIPVVYGLYRKIKEATARLLAK